MHIITTEDHNSHPHRCDQIPSLPASQWLHKRPAKDTMATKIIQHGKPSKSDPFRATRHIAILKSGEHYYAAKPITQPPSKLPTTMKKIEQIADALCSGPDPRSIPTVIARACCNGVSNESKTGHRNWTPAESPVAIITDNPCMHIASLIHKLFPPSTRPPYHIDDLSETTELEEPSYLAILFGKRERTPKAGTPQHPIDVDEIKDLPSENDFITHQLPPAIKQTCYGVTIRVRPCTPNNNERRWNKTCFENHTHIDIEIKDPMETTQAQPVTEMCVKAPEGHRRENLGPSAKTRVTADGETSSNSMIDVIITGDDTSQCIENTRQWIDQQGNFTDTHLVKVAQSGKIRIRTTIKEQASETEHLSLKTSITPTTTILGQFYENNQKKVTGKAADHFCAVFSKDRNNKETKEKTGNSIRVVPSPPGGIKTNAEKLLIHQVDSDGECDGMQPISLHESDDIKDCVADCLHGQDDQQTRKWPNPIRNINMKELCEIIKEKIEPPLSRGETIEYMPKTPETNEVRSKEQKPAQPDEDVVISPGTPSGILSRWPSPSVLPKTGESDHDRRDTCTAIAPHPQAIIQEVLNNTVKSASMRAKLLDKMQGLATDKTPTADIRNIIADCISIIGVSACPGTVATAVYNQNSIKEQPIQNSDMTYLCIAPETQQMTTICIEKTTQTSIWKRYNSRKEAEKDTGLFPPSLCRWITPPERIHETRNPGYSAMGNRGYLLCPANGKDERTCHFLCDIVRIIKIAVKDAGGHVNFSDEAIKKATPQPHFPIPPTCRSAALRIANILLALFPDHNTITTIGSATGNTTTAISTRNGKIFVTKPKPIKGKAQSSNDPKGKIATPDKENDTNLQEMNAGPVNRTFLIKSIPMWHHGASLEFMHSKPLCILSTREVNSRRSDIREDSLAEGHRQV